MQGQGQRAAGSHEALRDPGHNNLIARIIHWPSSRQQGARPPQAAHYPVDDVASTGSRRHQSDKDVLMACTACLHCQELRLFARVVEGCFKFHEHVLESLSGFLRLLYTWMLVSND